VCQTFRSDQETDGLGKLFETYAVASGCSEVFDYYKEGSNWMAVYGTELEYTYTELEVL
jgi:hypothetical protein